MEFEKGGDLKNIPNYITMTRLRIWLGNFLLNHEQNSYIEIFVDDAFQFENIHRVYDAFQ